MSNRAKAIVGVAIAATALLVVVPSFVFIDRLHYEFYMLPVRHEISEGEQGWPDRATEGLGRLDASWNAKNMLVEFLIQETDGSLVAEGLVMAVRIKHPRAKEIIEDHLSDTRWNWSLTNNDRLARNLLLFLQGEEGVESWVTHWVNGGFGDG